MYFYKNQQSLTEFEGLPLEVANEILTGVGQNLTRLDLVIDSKSLQLDRKKIVIQDIRGFDRIERNFELQTGLYEQLSNTIRLLNPAILKYLRIEVRENPAEFQRQEQ